MKILFCCSRNIYQVCGCDPSDSSMFWAEQLTQDLTPTGTYTQFLVDDLFAAQADAIKTALLIPAKQTLHPVLPSLELLAPSDPTLESILETFIDGKPFLYTKKLSRYTSVWSEAQDKCLIYYYFARNRRLKLCLHNKIVDKINVFGFAQFIDNRFHNTTGFVFAEIESLNKFLSLLNEAPSFF